jgi:uncharacterized protein (DUF488 family)
MSIIYTIGHSTKPTAELIKALKNFGITLLIDVRTIPRSRFNPQYNTENLQAALAAQHIGYEHMPGLGGLRRPTKSNLNKGWRNSSFRGYADYMQSDAFDDNLRKLIEKAKQSTIVIMCAEALPWRCHRSLIADALIAKGLEVHHIMDQTKDNPHELNKMAQIHDGKIQYPGTQQSINFNFYLIWF